MAADAVAADRRLHLKYEGTDTTIEIAFGPLEEVKREFSAAHLKQFGFDTADRPVRIEHISLEAREIASDGAAAALAQEECEGAAPI